MQKTILVVIGVVVIAAGVWYFIFSNTPFDRESVDTGDVVAIVNGEKISRANFEAFKSRVAAQQGFDIALLDAKTKSQFEAQVIDELIAQALLRQAVDESELTASQEEVDAQVDATVAQLGGEEAFQQALAAEGLSEEELRAQISANLATQAYLEQELNLSSIAATDEEVEAAYAQAAAQDETIPVLEDVREQVERLVIQQKQQALFTQFIQQLRAQADIEILI